MGNKIPILAMQNGINNTLQTVLDRACAEIGLRGVRGHVQVKYEAHKVSLDVCWSC